MSEDVAHHASPTTHHTLRITYYSLLITPMI